jgi:predicted secreted Zn-dependent protease
MSATEPTTPPVPDAGPARDARRRGGAGPASVAAPLLAGFILTSVCIALLVGWMRRPDTPESTATEAAPAVPPERAPDEPQSALADGAVPDHINLDLAYDEVRYEVSGSTAAEVFRSIDLNAPSTAQGKAAGLTRLQGRSYDYVRDHGTGECYITHVHALITVTLPDLQSAWTMPEKLVESWGAYERSVAAHEQQHVAIYRAGAERAVRLLEQQQPFQDKVAMERAFTETWSAEMASADAENDAFHRREVEDTKLEREVLTSELARVQRELDVAAERLAEIERAHPDLRIPADEARRHDEAASRLRELEADRQRLAEDLAWLR